MKNLTTEEDIVEKEIIPEGSKAAQIAQGILKWFSIIVMVIATGILSYVMICTARGELVDFFGNSFLRVVTGSMEPTILTGDYIIIDKDAVDDLKKDDIITFYSEEQGVAGLLVTHRIIDIDEKGDYITKGDANQIADELHVRKDQIVGKYKKKARFLRWTGSFADKRKLLLVVVVIPFLIASIYEMYSVGKLWKQVAQERKEESRQELEERLKREAIEEYLKNMGESRSEDEESAVEAESVLKTETEQDPILAKEPKCVKSPESAGETICGESPGSVVEMVCEAEKNEQEEKE